MCDPDFNIDVEGDVTRAAAALDRNLSKEWAKRQQGQSRVEADVSDYYSMFSQCSLCRLQCCALAFCPLR
jgi:hypothetical protein